MGDEKAGWMGKLAAGVRKVGLAVAVIAGSFGFVFIVSVIFPVLGSQMAQAFASTILCYWICYAILIRPPNTLSDGVAVASFFCSLLLAGMLYHPLYIDPNYGTFIGPGVASFFTVLVFKNFRRAPLVAKTDIYLVVLIIVYIGAAIIFNAYKSSQASTTKTVANAAAQQPPAHAPVVAQSPAKTAESEAKIGADIKPALEAAKHGDAKALAEIRYFAETDVTAWPRPADGSTVEVQRKAQAAMQMFLGRIYANGMGVQQDYLEALRWTRKAAEQGIAGAQTDLASMYYAGKGVTQNYAEAAKLARKAADQGDPNAEVLLGEMYVGGEGVPVDNREAVKWLHKAAEQGSVLAQSELGALLYLGQGVTVDFVKSHMWLSLAAISGNKDAAKIRDKMAPEMSTEQLTESQRLVREWKPLRQSQFKPDI